MPERDPFDEFDDINADDVDEAEAEAVEEAARDLRATVEGAEAPAPKPEPVPEFIPVSGPYPTEEPNDPGVLWSPRPGIVGCKKRGYQKIK